MKKSKKSRQRVDEQQRKLKSSVVDLDLLVQLPKILRRVADLEARVASLRTELINRSSVSDLVSVDEAVHLSGKSREALYKLIQRGVLPAVKRTRSLFVRRRDVMSERRQERLMTWAYGKKEK